MAAAASRHALHILGISTLLPPHCNFTGHRDDGKHFSFSFSTQYVFDFDVTQLHRLDKYFIIFCSSAFVISNGCQAGQLLPNFTHHTIVITQLPLGYRNGRYLFDIVYSYYYTSRLSPTSFDDLQYRKRYLYEVWYYYLLHYLFLLLLAQYSLQPTASATLMQLLGQGRLWSLVVWFPMSLRLSANTQHMLRPRHLHYVIYLFDMLQVDCIANVKYFISWYFRHYWYMPIFTTFYRPSLVIHYFATYFDLKISLPRHVQASWSHHDFLFHHELANWLRALYCLSISIPPLVSHFLFS